MNFINRNKTSKKLPTEYNGNRPGEKILIKKRYQIKCIQ